MTTDWAKVNARLKAARQRGMRRSRFSYSLLSLFGHPVSVAVIAAVLLTILTDQSWQTGATTAAVVVAAIVAILAREYATEPPFRPFKLRIDPTWGLIASDVAHLKESNPLYGEILKLPALVLTAVTPNLWYVNSHNEFATRLELEHRIRTDDFQFGYYFKQTIGGYEFGVITPDSSKESFMHGDDADHVSLGTLPYTELTAYYQHPFLTNTAHPSRAAREKFGWKEERIAYDMPRETDPTVLSNQYLWVSHGVV